MSSSLTGDIAEESSLLVSKRGEAERLTELFVCCLSGSGVAGVESTFFFQPESSRFEGVLTMVRGHT